MAANAVPTLLTVYKLWCVKPHGIIVSKFTVPIRTYRKIIIEDRGSIRRQSPVQKILLILVESGGIYFAVQVCRYPMSGAEITYSRICKAHLFYPQLSTPTANFNRGKHYDGDHLRTLFGNLRKL